MAAPPDRRVSLIAQVLAALLLWPLLPCGCAAPHQAGPSPRPDPSRAEVPLPAAAGWQASLVHDAGVGVWTVEPAKVFTRYGAPEVIGLDDRGRCTVLWSYSGKWTPRETIQDLGWLGALAVADVDPRVPGVEIYTGGQRGNLYGIDPADELTFDTRVLARYPGEELHTAVAGDLDPDRPGAELLVFTGSGQVHLLRPGAAADGSWQTTRLADLPGRVRQALILSDDRGGPTRTLAAVARSGQLMLLRLSGETLDVRVLASEPMGLGRLAQRTARPGAPRVLYVTRDDGVVLRFEERADDSWAREIIDAGSQGPRGIAAGRFDADPQTETVAVFGYGQRVELLSRAPGQAWRVETLFTDVDKGHWLSRAELDGRNATDELLASGYAGRIVLLARPPGYGLSGVPTRATDTDAPGD